MPSSQDFTIMSGSGGQDKSGSHHRERDASEWKRGQPVEETGERPATSTDIMIINNNILSVHANWPQRTPFCRAARRHHVCTCRRA